MDAAEYKHVVLGLIFLKYISDAFEAKHAELEAQKAQGADPEDRDEYRAASIFWVPKEARWQHLKASAPQPTIGTLVDDAMAAIERDNPSLKGVLPKDYARPGLDKQRLGQIINLVSDIALGSAADRAKDTLGRVYEYFLARFASAEGKSGGQFYTPSHVVRVLVEMLAPYKGRVYDPCCGSGGMFVQSEKFIEAHAGKLGDISIYGQESNYTTWRLAKMNLAIRGIDAQIAHGDTFHNDRHPDLKADYVLANPPFNDSDWRGELLKDDKRWVYGTPPAGNANYAWVQHFIHHLAPTGLARRLRLAYQRIRQYLHCGCPQYAETGRRQAFLEAFVHHDAMRTTSNTLELSASDLSQFLACRHRTALDLAVAQGLRAAPSWVDPALVLLQERGLEHERRYVDTLRGQGLQAVDLSAGSLDDAVSRASDAMRAGVDVIIQPALRDGRWFGRPDLLRRVETPSAFGSWSYEVVDTKLAKETRGGTILQLALYSDLLRVIQTTTPEHFHVVTPDPASPVETYRVQDFAAYFRLVRRRLEATVQQDADAIAAANYPEPVEHCDVCRWWSNCNKRRHDDDHLTLVASISRLQMRELEKAGITTLAKLGTLPLPLPFSPRRGASDTYVRVREQARIQLLGRSEGHPVHELLPLSPDHGLSRLPAPSPGDIFLDLEGDPFAAMGGASTCSAVGVPIVQTTRTSGHLLRDSSAYWAHSDAEERRAFEAVVDLILESWDANPGMHVYHYAPYEPSAFKRLMGRYATREAEIDRMLRAELFVDLHAVVKHSLRASVEQYSIKDLEVFYGFTRTVDLADARANLRVVERVLELEHSVAFTPPSPTRGGNDLALSHPARLSGITSACTPPQGEGRRLMPSLPTCGERSRATTATIVSRRAGCGSGSSACAPRSNSKVRRCRARSRRRVHPRQRWTIGLGV